MNKKLLNIGNVRYAPKEHNHDKSYSLTSHEHTNIKSSGLLAPQTGRTQELGDLYTYKTNDSVSGQPTPWSVILGWGIDGKCGVEICANYVRNDGLWYRTLRDYGDNWYNWDRIYTTQHKPTPAEIGALPILSNSTLWSGAWYMTEGQNITPSKRLSDCQTGWVLVWSDYDPSPGTANNYDFVYSYIRKDTIVNGRGACFLLGAHSGATSVITKYLYISDTQIKGHASNGASPSNDAILRAIYEF